MPRATLSVSELVDLTMEFYRRNYIEGLFLSSGVVRSPDYTMERLVRVAKDLRTVHRFNGYIHLKSIPGASRELVNEAGLYADRLSVNVEIPKEENLKLLAPEKDHKSVYAPMRYIQQGVLESSEERKKHRHAPRFAPDAYPDLDLEIDPKLSWALRHPEQFPVDINRADYEMLLRIPGVGVKSARLIVASRRFSKLGFYELKKIGVVMKKAQYFITCHELPMKTVNEMTPQAVRSLLITKPNKKKVDERQLLLDFHD